MAEIEEFGRSLKSVFDDGEKNEQTLNLDSKTALIGIEEIKPRREQPRKHFDEISHANLVASIRQQGIIQPVVVSYNNSFQHYDLIVGERRWRAAKDAGLIKIPALIKEYNQQNAMVVALMENIHRQDLGPIEEATAVQALISEFSFTHDQVAEKLSKSRSTVSNLLRLLDLCDEVKVLLDQGFIEVGHAKNLIGLNSEDQITIASNIVDNKLSVRQVEAIVKRTKYTKQTILPDTNSSDKNVPDWKNYLASRFHTNVDIRIKNNGKSSVTINFESVKELEWFVKNVDVRK